MQLLAKYRMSLGISGENTMSDWNTSYSRTCAILLLFILTMLIGCSSDKKDKADSATTETKDLDTNYYSHLSPEEQEIAEMLNEALQRLKYDDKSGLYELEFSYYTDENSYDEYIKRGEIIYAEMDSIHHLDVLDFTFYGDDSVALKVEYVFDPASDGTQSRLPDQFKLYWSHDRWVKPTVTRIHHQLEYDYKIEKAIEAAEEENQ